MAYSAEEPTTYKQAMASEDAELLELAYSQSAVHKTAVWQLGRLAVGMASSWQLVTAGYYWLLSVPVSSTQFQSCTVVFYADCRYLGFVQGFPPGVPCSG